MLDAEGAQRAQEAVRQVQAEQHHGDHVQRRVAGQGEGLGDHPVQRLARGRAPKRASQKKLRRCTTMKMNTTLPLTIMLREARVLKPACRFTR